MKEYRCLCTGDQLQQTDLHAPNHRHNRQPSVSSDAAAQHLQRSRVHPRLLDHESSVAGRAEADLSRDRVDQRCRGAGAPADAGRQ